MTALRVVFLSILGIVATACVESSPPPQSPGLSPGMPQSQGMDPQNQLGVWKSNFGPVKIEQNLLTPSGVIGVWAYQKAGQEVIGYFQGKAEGNIVRFAWNEPSQSETLQGEGYIVFDPNGQSFRGQWWTQNRDRGGEWNGWRPTSQVTPAAAPQPVAPQPAVPQPAAPQPEQPQPVPPNTGQVYPGYGG